MKKGITRRIDELGRIVIPVEIRRSMNLKHGDFLAIDTTNNAIMLYPAVATCPHCGKSNNLMQLDGLTICVDCAKHIKKMLE